MLTLFYSPHMSSVDNETGRASGHADVPLSPLGLQQTRELGQHYKTRQHSPISSCGTEVMRLDEPRSNSWAG